MEKNVENKPIQFFKKVSSRTIFGESIYFVLNFDHLLLRFLIGVLLLLYDDGHHHKIYTSHHYLEMKMCYFTRRMKGGNTNDC